MRLFLNFPFIVFLVGLLMPFGTIYYFVWGLRNSDVGVLSVSSIILIILIILIIPLFWFIVWYKDYWKKYDSDESYEKTKVSVNWQTLFWFIPVLALWALYRIEKLRKGALLIFAMTFGHILPTIPLIVLEGLGMKSDYFLALLASIGSIVMYGVGIGLGIYYVRKWSRQWNEKVDASDKQPSSRLK